MAVFKDSDGVEIEVGIDAEGATAGAAETVRSLETMEDAVKKTGGSFKRIYQDQAMAARDAGKELGTLGEATREVRHIFHGLEQSSEGGIRGLIGMATAARGLIGLFHTLGAVLIGPVGVALGVGAAAIHHLMEVAKKTEEETKKLFEGSKTRAEEYKDKLQSLQKASKESFDSQDKDLQNLIHDYSTLFTAIDKATARYENANAAIKKQQEADLELAKQKELSQVNGPKAPEKIAEIESKYADKKSALDAHYAAIEIENKRLQAQVQKANALNEIADIRPKREQANQTAADAEKKAADFKSSGATSLREAMELTQKYGADDLRAKARLDHAIEMQKEGLAAEAVAKEARKRADELNRQAVETMAAAEEKIRDANSVLETAPIEAKTAATQAKAVRTGKEKRTGKSSAHSGRQRRQGPRHGRAAPRTRGGADARLAAEYGSRGFRAHESHQGVEGHRAPPRRPGRGRRAPRRLRQEVN
jgi:hypothetical protein